MAHEGDVQQRQEAPPGPNKTAPDGRSLSSCYNKWGCLDPFCKYSHHPTGRALDNLDDTLAPLSLIQNRKWSSVELLKVWDDFFSCASSFHAISAISGWHEGVIPALTPLMSTVVDLKKTVNPNFANLCTHARKLAECVAKVVALEVSENKDDIVSAQKLWEIEQIIAKQRGHGLELATIIYVLRKLTNPSVHDDSKPVKNMDEGGNLAAVVCRYSIWLLVQYDIWVTTLPQNSHKQPATYPDVPSYKFPTVPIYQLEAPVNYANRAEQRRDGGGGNGGREGGAGGHGGAPKAQGGGGRGVGEAEYKGTGKGQMGGRVENGRPRATNEAKYVAAGNFDGTVKVWECGSGRWVKNMEGHTKRVYGIAVSPDGSTLASASEDGTIRLWNMATYECVKTLKNSESEGHGSPVYCVAFRSNGEHLASGSADGVRVWQVSSGECVATLSEHTDKVMCVAFSDDRAILASGGCDNSVKLWDVGNWQCKHTLEGHSGQVRGVTFRVGGQTIATCSDDNTIKLWDLHRGHCFKTLPGHSGPVIAARFSPDGSTLASASYDKSIKLWNMTSMHCYKNLTEHTQEVVDIAFDFNSWKLVSTSYDNTVRVWCLDQLKCLKTISEPDFKIEFWEQGVALLR